MKIIQLFEMAAKKICDKCGKSMAGHHYWYKGGWKCKAANLPPEGNNVENNTSPPENASPQTQQPTSPVQPDPAPVTPVSQPTVPVTPTEPQANEQPTDGNGAQVDVQTAPLEMTMTISVDIIEKLQDEIDKINKTATKIGAAPVELILGQPKFADRTRVDPDDPRRTLKYKQKMVDVTIRGTTPRLQAADGTTWDFIGVISASEGGRPILKLTPGTTDTEALRRLYQTDPYYCDYCRKIRIRNETFIVRNGDEYRQVGRNCLKDFVGGANPQAIMRFFSWFDNEEQLQEYLSQFRSRGGEGDGYGYGRESHHFDPIDVLSATIVSVKHRGAYVSSMADSGRSTSSDARWVLYGTLSPYATDVERMELRTMRKDMEKDEVKTEAKEILNWFRRLPQETRDNNTFFHNIDNLLQDEAVDQKHIGFIIGLYPAYQKAQQEQSEREGKVPLIKEWPDEWGDGPRQIVDKPADTKFIKHIEGVYGPVQIVYVMFEDGYGASWKYSGNADVPKGITLKLTGALERDTYHTPARIKFIPDRKWLRGDFKRQLAALEDAE